MEKEGVGAVYDLIFPRLRGSFGPQLHRQWTERETTSVTLPQHSPDPTLKIKSVKAEKTPKSVGQKKNHTNVVTMMKT